VSRCPYRSIYNLICNEERREFMFVLTFNMRSAKHVLLLLVLRETCCLAGASGKIPAARKFLVSGQGSGRCPDSVYTSGSRRDIRARSNIDCARQCTSSIDCLHYAFKGNAERCTLYTTTPVSVTYDEDCLLMLVGFHVYTRQR